MLLLFDRLTAPCQRRYGDAGEDSGVTACPGLHGGKRREGECSDLCTGGLMATEKWTCFERNGQLETESKLALFVE